MKKRIIESYKVFFKVDALKNENEEDTINLAIEKIVDEALNIGKAREYISAFSSDK